MSDIGPDTNARRKRRRVQEIPLPNGDKLVPRASFAEDEIGTTDRSLRRSWNLPTTLINGVAFIARDASLKIIGDSVKRPNTVTPKRHRRP